MIGSYLLKTLTKPKISVDVAVEIPQVTLFDDSFIMIKGTLVRSLNTSG